jgi:hypothetical protein
MLFIYGLARAKDGDSDSSVDIPVSCLRQSKDQNGQGFKGRSLYSILIMTLIGLSYGVVLLFNSHRVNITPDSVSRIYGSEHWQLPPPYPVFNGGGTARPIPTEPHRSLPPLMIHPQG